MSQYDFEHMDAGDIASTIFYNADPLQVAPMFEELATLDAQRRTAVVNMLEGEGVHDIKQGGKLIRMILSAAEMMGTVPDLNQVVDAERLAYNQAAAEVYRNIAGIKGEATHPLMKAYVAEIDALSTDEYNSPQLLVAAVRALDAYEAQQPKKRSLFDMLFGPEEPQQAAPQAPKAAPKTPPQAASPTQGSNGKGRHFKL